MPLLMWMLACITREPNPCPLGCETVDSAADTAPIKDTADTGEPPQPVAIPTGCAPETQHEDPFVLIGSKMGSSSHDGGWFTEILDIAYLPNTAQVITAGQGGVVLFNVQVPSNPELNGFVTHDGTGGGRYYNVRPLDATLAWATHREFGLHVLNVGNPDQPTRITTVDAQGYEGLDVADGVLYVANTNGTVDLYDVQDPTDPQLLTQVTGLERPWDVRVQDGHLYVADAVLGLVVYDLSEPTLPLLLTAVDSPGQPFRLDGEPGHVYMVSGAGGLEIFDVSDPSNPDRVSVSDVGGGALDVAVHDGLAGVVTQEAVVLLDIGRSGTPENPLPFAYEETEQYAMTIDAQSGWWVVGDWGIMGMWQAGDVPAPAMDLSVDTVAFLDEAEQREVYITNRGGDTLTLIGASMPDGVDVLVSTLNIAPGERASLFVDWDGKNALEEGMTLCLASNDPGRPTMTLNLSNGSSGKGQAIGQDAPDFTLLDLDGVQHRLSEQIGHPVLLAYFATW